jgi:hypothetical protein
MDGLSDAERIGRLEERVASVHGLLTEMRAEQREMAQTISRASGGVRVLLLLGGVVGLLRAAGTWLQHPNGGGS